VTFEFKVGLGANQDVADRFVRAFNPPPDNGATNGHGRRKSTTSGAPLVADEVIIERIRGSRSAEKFEMLFDAGDESAYDGPSEADFALLCVMRFWTQDRTQLVRLMKRSALYRPRWDERYSGRQTRLEYSVERALSGNFETYEWPAQRLSSSHDTLRGFVDDDNVQVEHSEREGGLQVVFFRDLGEPKPREFLIETVAPKGYPVVAYGAGGVAKSFAVLTAGILIASNDTLADPRWLGYRVLKHGHVLYVDFELDQDEQHRRVRDLCNGLGMPIPSRLAYLSGVGHRPETVFRRAGEFCQEHKAVATILDSVGLAADGDMDKGRDTLAFHRRYVNALRRAGTTPFLVDHEGKLQAGEKRGAKSIIGSIYKSASARSVLHFM
jgi:AAA domain